MSYYFQQFDLPADPPFDDATVRWPTCVGEFIKPVVDAHPDLIYWFSYYDDHVQWCLYTENYADIRPLIEARMPTLGITWRRQPEPQDTLEGDCARQKFYDHPKKDQARRAELVLRFLHSVSALYVDQLIQRADGKWTCEPNSDHGNNCDGVIFQSLLHMLCNLTQVPTPVFTFTLNGNTSLESSLTILNAGLQKGARYDVHF